MKIIFFVFLLFLVPEVYARDNFKIPKHWQDFPVSYLEELKIENPSRQLSPKELRDLCRLFIKAYVVTRREYQLDSNLNTNAPAYRLLKTNLPGMIKKEIEGHTGIFLQDIFFYLYSLPEYKNEVEQIIREAPFKKWACQR